jgi:hypothetical protein
MEQNNKEAIKEQLDKMQLNEKDLEKQLDRMLDMYKQLDFEKQLEKNLEKLDELIQEQRKLADETEKNQKPVNELQKKQEELQKELDSLSQEFKELEKLDEELEKENGFDNPEQDLKEIGADMDAGKEQLEKKRKKDAAKKQKDAADKMQKLKEKIDLGGFVSTQSISGQDLNGLEYHHPFLDRKGKIITADYVSSEDGTGIVHIAPGHGADDFQLGRAHALLENGRQLCDGRQAPRRVLDTDGRRQAIPLDWRLLRLILQQLSPSVNRQSRKQIIPGEARQTRERRKIGRGPGDPVGYLWIQGVEHHLPYTSLEVFRDRIGRCLPMLVLRELGLLLLPLRRLPSLALPPRRHHPVLGSEMRLPLPLR